MVESPKPLLTFRRPPLTEVALSVQFQPLDAMRTAHVGLLWNEFRREFPNIEDLPPLAPAFELFGARRSVSGDLSVELSGPLLNRAWFLNRERTQLIQVQRDRLIHNWRQVGPSDEYPRYEAIREVFKNELEVFRAFVEREGLGDLIPNQVEVTYVNHIVAGEGWSSHADLARIVTFFRGGSGDSSLPPPEEAEMVVHYTMRNDKGEPLGRLHVAVQPLCRRVDGAPIYQLRLTGRGRPEAADLSGVLEIMDCARGWAVLGFSEVTTPEMHALWQREDRGA